MKLEVAKKIFESWIIFLLLFCICQLSWRHTTLRKATDEKLFYFQVSISPKFYKQVLHTQIPKRKKRQSNQAAFCVKAEHKHVDEIVLISPAFYEQLFCMNIYICLGLYFFGLYNVGEIDYRCNYLPTTSRLFAFLLGKWIVRAANLSSKRHAWENEKWQLSKTTFNLQGK